MFLVVCQDPAVVYYTANQARYHTAKSTKIFNTVLTKSEFVLILINYYQCLYSFEKNY